MCPYFTLQKLIQQEVYSTVILRIFLNREADRPLSLGQNATWNFIGKFIYAASRGVIIMLIAKLGSANMVGEYALAMAVTTPVFLFADLNLRSVYVTDTADQYTFSQYFTLRCAATLIVFIGITGFALLSGLGPKNAIIIIFVAIAKSAETISEVVFGLFQKNERMDRLASP